VDQNAVLTEFIEIVIDEIMVADVTRGRQERNHGRSG